MQLNGGAAEARQRLVIVVEDDENARLAIRDALSGAGFEVITASDGATALLVAGVTSPAAMVLDVDVPTLKSLVEARDVGASRGLRATPVEPMMAITND